MATISAEPDRADDARQPEAGLTQTAARLGHRVLVVFAAGFLCGGVIGGVGGRIAMFVLRLTSDDLIIGLETDDGFTIGSITTSTIFLVMATAFLGAACGLFYLAARRFVPSRHRMVAAGVLFGALGGALVLKPGEFDFRLVEPPLLSVVLFILLPAGFGIALSMLVERWLGDADEQRAWYWMIPLLVMLFTGLFGIVILLALALGLFLADRFAVFSRAWRSQAVLWSGRGLLSAFTIFLTVDTARAAMEII